MKFEWEEIYKHESENSCDLARRAKVYGGWMVHTVIQVIKEVRDSTVFIPDPNHEWKIED